jgi:hypothetical protein
MTPSQHLRLLLRELRWEHPGAHPHTLACLLMAQFGVETTGARVRELLGAPQ